MTFTCWEEFVSIVTVLVLNALALYYVFYLERKFCHDDHDADDRES
jgi:hypothetical protein